MDASFFVVERNFDGIDCGLIAGVVPMLLSRIKALAHSKPLTRHTLVCTKY